MIDAQQILTRFQSRTGRYGSWDGKFLGRDCRLRWNRNVWRLEEMPQKGKKKLRVSTASTFMDRGWHGFSSFIPENVLDDAKLSRSDNYDRVKDKLTEALRTAADIAYEKQEPDKKEHFEWIKKEPRWDEFTEHFLKIEPEDTDPIEAKGKDFTLHARWTSFKVYDPKSDFQQADPHYTMYESTAPASARKLYKILKADPTALKNVSWGNLTDWFRKNKINWETHFSQWR